MPEEHICTCHKTQEIGQAPGPKCPTASVLAFLLDEVVEPGDWIKAVAINGQTGVVKITSYRTGEGEKVQTYPLRGISDVL